MDPIWLLAALILVVVFASISIVGTLHRIHDASENTFAILETQAAAQNPGEPSRRALACPVLKTFCGRRDKARRRVRLGFRVLPLQRSFLELLQVAHTGRYLV